MRRVTLIVFSQSYFYGMAQGRR